MRDYEIISKDQVLDCIKAEREVWYTFFGNGNTSDSIRIFAGTTGNKTIKELTGFIRSPNAIFFVRKEENR